VSKPKGSSGEMTKTSHPSGDKRFKVLDVAMKRHQFQPDALIEILHKAQDLFGFLADDVLFYVARGLKLPPSRVYGVATFYHLFTLKPQGRHTCVVCMGTACFVKGAQELLRAAETAAGVVAGGTTPDHSLSLLTSRCLGACGIAPAVVYDGTWAGHQGAADVVRRVQGWLSHGS
jgi:bidirectional [NiFe] hydrogenase diaphorase subunit